MWETTLSSIKVLENTYAKNQKLKIEVVTKMDNYFTICQYKTEKPKIIEIITSISLKISLFWCEVDKLSLRSKISALQTFLYADLFTTFRYSNTMALLLLNSLL